MKSKKVGILIFTLALIILAFFSLLTFKAMHIEYLELGPKYQEIFFTNTVERILIAVSTFSISFITLIFVNKGITNGVKTHLEKEQKIFLQKYGIFFNVLISGIFAYISQSFLATQILTLTNLAWFGKKEQIFGLDYTYFIVATPIIMNILKVIISYIIMLAVYITAMYISSINKYTDGITIEELRTSRFLKQIIKTLYVFTFAIVLYILLSHQDILVGDMLKNHSINGLYLTGAGSIDVTVKLWGLRFVTLLFIYSVISFVKGIKKNDSKKMVVSIFIVPIAIVLLFTFVFIYEKISASTSEIDREKNHIENNINSTKEAYNLEIENNEIEKAEELSKEQIKNLKETLNNIPIVSKSMISKTLEVKKEYDGVYKFRNSTLMNNKDGYIYVTPREIDLEKEKTKLDKQYKYTHGNFAVITSANKIDPQGIIQNIEEKYENQEYNGIKVSEPRIYYGLDTTNSVFVSTKQGKEEDYPISLMEFSKNTYTGKGGIKLNFLDRLALTIQTKDTSYLINSNYEKDTKVLLNRQILKRAAKAIPNFVYDKNPYLVINKDGKLYWVIDGYTMTDRYPYSQKLPIQGENGGRERINYIRNSVKVLVDTYTGKMDYYLTDKNDPLALIVNNMYPNLFSKEEIPEFIADQFIYPQYLFDVQARAIAIYHNTKVDTLYRADDLWQVSGSTNSYLDQKANSEYVLVKEKDEASKLGLMSVYTMKNKRAINAYLVGEISNGKQKLKLNRYAKNDNILIRDYISSQIQADKNISEEINKISSIGSEIASEEFLMPIENTMLYIKTYHQVYINEKTPPVLKKVIVANGSKVAIGDNLTQAINNLFTAGVVNIDITEELNIDLLLEAVIKQNQELEKSIKTNNLEYIGKDTEKLRLLIKQLEEAIEYKKKNTPKELPTKLEDAEKLKSKLEKVQ